MDIALNNKLQQNVHVKLEYGYISIVQNVVHTCTFVHVHTIVNIYFKANLHCTFVEICVK